MPGCTPAFGWVLHASSSAMPSRRGAASRVPAGARGVGLGGLGKGRANGRLASRDIGLSMHRPIEVMKLTPS
eukprot:15476324-Alexandrium_andersonii.AAC.1